jgi:cytochrome P450
VPGPDNRLERNETGISHAPERAPGPKGLELLRGVLGARTRDPLLYYRELIARHGDVVAFALGTKRFCLVNDPAGIEHVLKTNARNYTKGPGYERFRAFIGNGLLTSEGEFWRRQRRLAQPPFHHDSIARFADTVAETSREAVDAWATHPAGAPVDMAAEMMRLTLSLVGRTLLGSDPSARADDVRIAIAEIQRKSDEQLNSSLRVLDLVLPLHKHIAFAIERRLPTASNRRFRRAVAVLDAIVSDLIRRRRLHPTPGGRDLLTLLIQARDEEGQPGRPGEGEGTGMTDTQLRDEVMTMFLAGHETTAAALAWAFYLLDRHPAVLTKVTGEIASVVGDRPPTFKDLAALPYTRRVWDEVLRLYPPFWRISRQAIADDVVAGFRVPAGCAVLLAPYLTQRHPAYWPDPDAFDPDRFLPEAVVARPRFAYFPFGGGPRTCIGNSFANMEALIVLVTVLPRYRLRLWPGHEVVPEPRVSLRPRGGLLMSVEPAGAEGE